MLSETDKPDVGTLSSHHTDKLQKHREVGTNRDGGKVDWTELHAKIEQKLLPLFLIRKTSLI